ncbi:hypothetical protein BVRB_6g152450 [Beta vulgaris subsp. vulgaris]|nr:hypothetical protein BVRB_6g152450 [Beta vulgaris subsp. vulgaris]
MDSHILGRSISGRVILCCLSLFAEHFVCLVMHLGKDLRALEVHDKVNKVLWS